MKNLLLGSVTSGIIAIITTKIVELIAYVVYPGPLLLLYLIVFLCILLLGFTLYRHLKTHIPIKYILIVVLAIIGIRVGLDLFFDLLASSMISSEPSFSLLPSLLESLSLNKFWFIGGVFVGINTAVVLPVLKRFNMQNNLPLLIVTTLFLIGFTFFGRYQYRYNAGNGFVIFGLSPFGIVFWAMLVGSYVARKLQKSESTAKTLPVG